MIRSIQVSLNAAHPELPLVEATGYVGAPSTAFIRGVPRAVGSWRITAVRVAVAYPDNSARTFAATISADGVWTATIAATETSGRVVNGFQVLADGIDETGAAVEGYVLGVADFAVFARDMTIDAGGTSWYMHLFDAAPNPPRKGDVAPVDGALKYYDGEAWQPFADLDNYYTKAQTDEAINALAAYYITANAQGAAFATYAALANAETFYSGGAVRIPTRNDYAVVLADETHGGAEYRYIYAVPTEGGEGHWEAQYPIETNEYTALQHKPQIGGVELVGNKTLAQLGIASAADATLTALTGFSPWTIYREGVDVTAQVSDQPRYVRIGEDIYAWLIETVHIATDQVDQDLIGGPENATSLSWRARDGEFNAVSYTAVRKALSGYRLGPADGPNADKHVASEAEAEELREKKYEKPSSGIPKSDLASTVQASLGKADTAVQPEQGKGLFSGSYNDLSNKPPLGTAAAKDVPVSGDASSSQVVMGNDTRLGDARTPTAHKSTHASGGTDALSPADIGAAPASDLPYSFHAATVSSGTTPTVTNVADRAINSATLGSSVTAATVTLPAATADRARDFYIDLTIEASSAPTLTFIDPATSTTANVAFGANSLADIAPGYNLVLFTELPNNRWLVRVKHEEDASYAQIAFLESTGTQWIDTGINPSYITYFKISFSTTNLDMAGNKCIVGGGAFNAYAWLLVFQNDGQLRFYGDGTSLASITQGEEATFEIEATQSTTNNMNFVVKKNGAQTYSGTITSQYTATGSLYLFSMNGGSFAANRLRIHYVDINNHKFIPVRVGSGSSAVGYMYDRVTQELFGNAGTGDFVIGPDI